MATMEKPMVAPTMQWVPETGSLRKEAISCQTADPVDRKKKPNTNLSHFSSFSRQCFPSKKQLNDGMGLCTLSHFGPVLRGNVGTDLPLELLYKHIILHPKNSYAKHHQIETLELDLLNEIQPKHLRWRRAARCNIQNNVSNPAVSTQSASLCKAYRFDSKSLLRHRPL